MHRFVAPIHAIVDAIRARLAHIAAPTGEAGRCARPARIAPGCIVSAGPRPAFG
ncbi:amino acid ABC transporter substrate-binding protein [Burkholderia pseudomallei]|nr:amino acid ABC transporter substrate-binding protein [Burkholderia pseudomallei]EEH29409.1 conserved hypothetical protein [Burkholderia pseudomallei Pakistan 9]KEO66177.1 amino acid ABC transporter substrate-binding protein [Burkholderia pseudomallei MSHR5855]ALB12831.1 amino acid ABC transporter substrate-binding protein [Burkholderia pseudomallei]ALB93066.1 amino acid ABC transporter substrate-binding protein [Burkholderia pseudomallei]